MIHARVFDPEYNAGTGTYAPATVYRRRWAPTQGKMETRRSIPTRKAGYVSF